MLPFLLNLTLNIEFVETLILHGGEWLRIVQQYPSKSITFSHEKSKQKNLRSVLIPEGVPFGRDLRRPRLRPGIRRHGRA